MGRKAGVQSQALKFAHFPPHAPFRGKQIAQKLLAHAQKAAEKHGFHTLWLGTVEKLAGAHAFYKKCGFCEVQEKELPEGFEKCALDTRFFKYSLREPGQWPKGFFDFEAAEDGPDFKGLRSDLAADHDKDPNNTI